MNYNLISISCMELIRSSNTNLLLEKKKKTVSVDVYAMYE